MQNRYFSAGNASLIKSSEAHQPAKDHNEQEEEKESANEKSTTEHSKEFNERKEFLLKKLFQSRNLPTNENTIDNQKEDLKKDESSQNENKESESTEKIEFKPYKPDRKHEFQDDFIPLFGSGTKSDVKSMEDNKPRSSRMNENSESDDDIEDITESVKKVYDPKLNVFDSYRGPYSVRCLTKARQHLIEAFKSTSFAHTDRTFEIVKVKLNIKSKFDNDIKLKRRIKRDTQAVRQIIQDKLDLYYKRCHNNPMYMRPAHYKTKSQHHIRFNDSDTIMAKSKNRIQAIELDESSSSSIQHNESDEEESENGNTSDNEEDVIKMINEPETVINLSSDEEEDDDDEEEEEDSKYVQFGKYSKNLDNSSSKNSTKSTHTSSRQTVKRKIQAKTYLNNSSNRSNNESDDDQLEEHFFSKVLKKNSSKNSHKSTHQSKQNNENDDENKLENLELEYKNIRNKRNKLLRKRKGDEVNIERKLMSDQLKLIRRQMKKLRRKKFNKFDHSRSNRYFDLLDEDEPERDNAKQQHNRNKGHLKYALNKKPQNLIAFQGDQTKKRNFKKMKNNNKKQAKVILNSNKKSNNKFGQIKTNKQNF